MLITLNKCTILSTKIAFQFCYVIKHYGIVYYINETTNCVMELHLAPTVFKLPSTMMYPKF